jgi:hypothetical protein
MSVTFRMSGAACGSCVHRHVTIDGAAKCATAFEQDCDARGGYSDRRLVVFDDDGRREPTAIELQAFAAAVENHKANSPSWARKQVARRPRAFSGADR